MASLFEQASLAKRASDEQLVNILSNRMPSVDISQAVAMAELTSRKNMRNAAANQEMIQQGIGAVPVKDQVIAETVQSQNPQMVNPNLVAMSSPEMGNVPRSEAMDMSAPGSIPGAAAGGIVSSYKEPEGRETRGIPAAVRMFEGGKVSFQDGGYLRKRLDDLDTRIAEFSALGKMPVDLIRDRENVINELKTLAPTTDPSELTAPGPEPMDTRVLYPGKPDLKPDDPFFIEPGSEYMREAALERGEDPSSMNLGKAYDRKMEQVANQEASAKFPGFMGSPKEISERVTEDDPQKGTPEYITTGPRDFSELINLTKKEEEEKKDPTIQDPKTTKDPKTTEDPKETVKKLDETEKSPSLIEDARKKYQGSREKLMENNKKLIATLQAGKKDIKAAIEGIGNYSVEETQKLEEFRKPFNEYLAKLNKKLGRKKGDMLGNSLVKAGVALASSNDPLFVGIAKAVGIGVDTANSIQDKYDSIEDSISQLKITQSQADEARLVGDKQRRDQAALKGAELNASINNSIATATSDLSKTLLNSDQTQLNNLLTYSNQLAQIKASKDAALQTNNFNAYKFQMEQKMELAKTVYTNKNDLLKAELGVLKEFIDPLNMYLIGSLKDKGLDPGFGGVQNDMIKRYNEIANILDVGGYSFSKELGSFTESPNK